MKGKGDHCFKVIIHHKNSYAVILITSDKYISTNGHNEGPFWADQIKEKKLESSLNMFRTIKMGGVG